MRMFVVDDERTIVRNRATDVTDAVWFCPLVDAYSVGGPVGRFAGIVTIGCQVRDNKLLRTFW